MNLQRLHTLTLIGWLVHLQGGILPPVEVYWEFKKDEDKPDFVKHTRGYLLHNTKPIEAMTEERAIEYLIMKDIPQHVWRNYRQVNKPRMVICTKSQLPSTRVWRNAWKINEDITTHNEEHLLKGETNGNNKHRRQGWQQY